jgi:Ca2+-binding RTX toxin-like protein
VIVSDASTLLQALATAQPGDTIQLASGNYGDVLIQNLDFAANVTIASADPANPAVFDTLRLKSVSNLTLDGIQVTNELEPGEPTWSSALRIDQSLNIQIVNSEITGSVDGDYRNDANGIVVLDSENITISDSSVHDLTNGISVGRSTGVSITNNQIYDIRTDGIQAANTRGTVIDGNIIRDFHPAYDLGDHPDMIQIWNDGSFGDVTDITITNNQLLKGTGDNVQAILIQGQHGPNAAPYTTSNITIAQNTIDAGSAQGIWVSDAENVTIDANVITEAAGADLTPGILTQRLVDSAVTNNTAPTIDDVDSVNLTSTGNTTPNPGGDGVSITGTDGADILEGSAFDDVLYGLAGDDNLTGLAGNDEIEGGDGNDFLRGNDGDDRLIGGNGDDELRGDAGNDIMYGGGGADLIVGGDGDDLGVGGGGNDTIRLGKGNDSSWAGGGNDYIDGNAGDDMLRGDGGHDELRGSAGNDTLWGDQGHDGLRGGSGFDTLYGGDGDDRLNGGGDDDILQGGAGNDTLTGGRGSDTFVWALEDVVVGGVAQGTDRITDLRSEDVLDISDLVDADDLSALQQVATLELSGGELRLSIDIDGATYDVTAIRGDVRGLSLESMVTDGQLIF